MYYTAIVMGLAGSLHCAGMCSPLAMAMTRNRPFLRSSILYNTGRVFIYGLLGSLVAAFGSLLDLHAYQQIISIVLGVMFLLAGCNIGALRIPLFDRTITAFSSGLRKVFGMISSQSYSHTLLLGMLNGLLPCGLTYFALSACLILPSANDGLLFMLFFGLGTWPVMIGSVKLLSLLKNNFSLARLSRIALVFVGCVLLLRVWWMHPHPDMFVEAPQEVNVCK